MNNKFEYKYNSTNKSVKDEVEKIRNKYIPNKNQNKINELKNLNRKVELLPTLIAFLLGIIGTLIFGTGLAMVLEWKLYIYGSIVAVMGFIPAALAYPLYQKFYTNQKEKYTPKILKISEEILNDSDE